MQFDSWFHGVFFKNENAKLAVEHDVKLKASKLAN